MVERESNSGVEIVDGHSVEVLYPFSIGYRIESDEYRSSWHSRSEAIQRQKLHIVDGLAVIDGLPIVVTGTPKVENDWYFYKLRYPLDVINATSSSFEDEENIKAANDVASVLKKQFPEFLQTLNIGDSIYYAMMTDERVIDKYRVLFSDVLGYGKHKHESDAKYREAMELRQKIFNLIKNKWSGIPRILPFEGDEE